MSGSPAIGVVVAALPLLLAVAWAVRRRVAGRYLACLLAAVAGAAGLAALFALAGSHITYDPSASSELGNWSGVAGAVLGLGLGWIAGAVAGPALLLRALGSRLDGTRLVVAAVTGAVISGVLVYAMIVLRLGDGPATWPARGLAALSSCATFAGLVLASRERARDAPGARS